jgi:acetylornithine/N-succinyldiaminopimelate aminotransferase
MPTFEEIKSLDDRFVMQTYKRLPGLFVRGEGCSLWDSEGNEYLDFLAGIAVCQLGHCHPAVVEALARQGATLIHTSNHLLTEPQARLAERLCQLSDMDKVFFTVDGTTANETALKIAKKHGLRKRPAGDYEIITLLRSFHGRTLGALSATAQSKYQEPFRPLLPGFRHIGINDLQALRNTFSERTAAIIFEPIQGEGGVMPVSDEFAREARNLAQKNDALLIVDEVQTGIGRTGKWFAFQHYHLMPDVLCLAKALGSGMPIGACLTRGEASEVLGVGDHGSTFGGGALAAAVALAVLDTIEKDNLLENAEKMGQLLRSRLKSMGKPVQEVRGRGLMIGVRLDQPIAREVVAECLRQKFITNATDEHMLRLVPPITINEQHVERALEVLSNAMSTVAKSAVPV